MGHLLRKIGTLFTRNNNEQYPLTICDYENQTFIDERGYRRFRRPQELVHRWVYHTATGKPIPTGYHIHHRDGNKLNNTPENLEALSPSDHHSKHLKAEIRGNLISFLIGFLISLPIVFICFLLFILYGQLSVFQFFFFLTCCLILLIFELKE
jgi:hypothetical protein